MFLPPIADARSQWLAGNAELCRRIGGICATSAPREDNNKVTPRTAVFTADLVLPRRAGFK